MDWNYIDSLFMNYNGTDQDIAAVTDLSYDAVHRFRAHACKSPSWEVVSRVVLCLGGSLDAVAGVTECPSNPDTSDAARVRECMAYFRSELIRRDAFYHQMIRRRKALLYFLAIACAFFFIAFVIIMFIDYISPNAGWIMSR